jgi:hypothetical protein
MAETVSIRPANRSAFTVERRGRHIVLVETNYVERGRGDSGYVAVVRRERYVVYGRTGDTVHCNVQPAPFETKRLAYAVAREGPEAVDRIRQRWSDPPGVSRREAQRQMEKVAREMLGMPQEGGQ